MSGSTDSIGRPPELAWLPVDRLDVDDAYQRTLDTRPSQKLIEKIAANFRWIAFGAILATPVGHGDERRWLIIDGQHRVAAAKRVGIPHVPAVVVAEASQSEQAAAFVGANKDRVPMTAQALFHARLLAGDPEAAALARIAAEAGIKLSRYPMSPNRTPAGATSAVPALLTALRLYGEAATQEACKALAQCFGTIKGALLGKFFLAAARCLKEGGDPEKLRQRLRRFGVAGLSQISFGLTPNSGIAALVVRLRDDAAEPPKPEEFEDPAAVAPPPFKKIPLPEPASRKAAFPRPKLPDRAEGTARRVTDSDVAGSELVWDQESKSHKRIAVDATPEDAAVLTLRRDGDVVFREGKSFSVNGRAMTAAELLQKAERVRGNIHV